MKVLIIGSGGREHALCHALKKSSIIKEIFCIPGNAGTDSIAKNFEVDMKNFQKIKEFVNQYKIDLVIIGPEQPLVDGIVDYLNENNIKVFGPNKIASQLEGSKTFTKELCKKYNIPTAKFGIFEDIKSANKFLEKCNLPIVIKADGLASGKGVYICNNKNDAIGAIQEIFNGKFGIAKKILIEEFLDGEEMSFFIISDGETYYPFGTAQDHKRVYEGDKGKNTGGMGAYSPSRLENDNLNKKIIDKIINPTLKGLKDLNTKFEGFLYAGLMIVKNEPFLIEYNVRMGDPECQTIIPKLKTDFAEVVNACVNKNLKSINLEWHKDKSLCVVLCSKGYPDKYEKSIEIKNLEKIELNKNEFIFHAGTKKINQKIYSNGGRVLNFVIRSKNFKENRDKIINLINQINWINGFYRKDIGYKVID
ncbi:phosphoribosylamine--glycine ligase [Candidatus Pelagibacter sp.]|jgi:phosphoribosylamine--glycine ligase|nr:phosphoribosylamine--glycine ligase [Candidatus Pelagibacter sp.]|tara:strand:- start:2707 stop:3969 length:1263 start_codon:yes stop_codon:yes gene_type:complete